MERYKVQQLYLQNAESLVAMTRKVRPNFDRYNVLIHQLWKIIDKFESTVLVVDIVRVQTTTTGVVQEPTSQQLAKLLPRVQRPRFVSTHKN